MVRQILWGMVIGGCSLPMQAIAQCGGLQNLGTLGGEGSAVANAVSANGNTAVGFATSASAGLVAFHWTAAGGMQALATLGGDYAEARAVSADGSVVAGLGLTLLGRQEALRWTPDGAVHILGSLGGNFAEARAVCADGTAIVGVAHNAMGMRRAFRWTAAEGMQDLGTVGGVEAESSGLSANGTVAVGWSYNAMGHQRAFRWTVANGMQDLGTLGGAVSNACGISADGSVVVGWADDSMGRQRAFRWTPSGGMQDLGTLGGANAEARAISSDGTSVIGEAADHLNQRRAFRWTLLHSMQDLGALMEGGFSQAIAVSADGSSVVGNAEYDFGYYHAFYWTAETGILDLGTFGGTGSAALAVSSDGSTIVGNADTDGSSRAFRWGGDTDGDGIPDDWECNGIPYTKSDHTPGRYVLPRANSLMKDIFVEVDAMTGRAPSLSTLQRVVDAFDPPGRVLVPGMPGVDGALPNVTLHIQSCQDDLSLNLLAGGNYIAGTNGFDDFAFDKARYFGTPDERADPDWGTPANPGPMQLAKRKVYRYCIFANSYDDSRSSGVAKGIPTNDFMVTLGAADGGNSDQQAATFMHELGHTLGLRHGGGPGNSKMADINGVFVNLADIHWRPNYYSIMSYWWQFQEQSWQSSAWGLRYSEECLPSLHEASLNELLGIGGSRSDVSMPYRVGYVPKCLGVAYYSEQGLPFRLASFASGTAVDWNNDCTPTAAGIAVDINDFSAILPPNAKLKHRVLNGFGTTVLSGHHDWANLVYDFRSSPTSAQGAPAEPISCKYDDSVRAFMRSITESCPSDLNSDGFVDDADFSIFVIAYNLLLCDDPAMQAGCSADLNSDMLVDDTDFSIFVVAYNELLCP